MGQELACPFVARERWRRSASSTHPLVHVLSPGQNATASASNATVGWLLGLSGAHAGEDFRLTEGETVLGSGWDADLVLTTPEVSRQHARLNAVSGIVNLEDNGSATGVSVNREKIMGPHVLQHGDVLKIGVGEFLYVSLAGWNNNHGLSEALQAFLKVPQATVGWLLCHSGEYAGMDFRLRLGPNRIGTLPGLEITLPDPNLNSVHFTLDVAEQRCFLRNPSAGCAVFRSGKLIEGLNQLRDLDVLRIGACELSLRSLL